MIEVDGLSKHFGLRRAVDGISFSVGSGTILGFLGPNGAGKTTTIRMLAGYLRPTGGSAVVAGCDVLRDPEGVQARIGYMPENAPLWEDMTVEAFLRFIAELRGWRGGERERRVGAALDLCLLSPVRHQSIETLSKGYRQRTCLAQALLHDPPVLLLDEPTEGLDPNQKQVVREMIRRMGKEKTILISTHILEEVEAICNRVIIISEGRIVVDSTPAELKRRSDSYNVLTVELLGPRDQVHAALRQLEDVAEVALLESRGERHCFRIVPRERRSLAAPLVAAAQAGGWTLLELRSDSGRLEEVFRRITVTEDSQRRRPRV